MAQFVRISVEINKDPRAMEVRGLGRGACVDQHGCCLDTICFATYAVDAVSKSCKHLAPHLPAVQLGCGIGGSCTRHGSTDLVGRFSGHRAMMGRQKQKV